MTSDVFLLETGKVLKRQAIAAVAAILLVGSGAFAGDSAVQLKGLKAGRWTVPDVGLKMVRIPAGRFLMGSPKAEQDRREDEVPHEVTISRPFYMGVYEVTQQEFYGVMLPDFDHGSWPYARGPIHKGLALFYRARKGRDDYEGGKLNLRHPMECVTWQRAAEFCRRLTETERKAGRLPEGYVYRLPTEAEWEYACRAGAKGPYNVKAEREGKEYLRSAEYLSRFANVGGGKTMPVGQRKPNAWGLHDMHGNVYEWCLDRYGPYPSGEVTDPIGPAEAKKRVARGGCFNGSAPFSPPGQIARSDCFSGAGPFLRSASRYSFDPNVSFYAILGFRVVLGPDLQDRGPGPKADQKLFERFGKLFGAFGKNSTTKVEVVSGPKPVKMRNGRVGGKQWWATCGRFRFKLTIQDETKVKLNELVKRIEKLPMPYVKACEVVSDATEDGVAVYASLGGAAAHGGQSYINIVPRAGALVIAHEVGHALEQSARSSDPAILDRWEQAIEADKISVSNYGDKVRHEDLGEFAKVYAVCLDAGPKHLAELKKLSPARFALWEEILAAPRAGWSQWRGNNRDGKSPDKRLLKNWPAGGPELLWKVTGIGQGFSNVSLGGGLIYTTGRKQAGNPTTLPVAKHVYARPGERLYLYAIDKRGKYKWARDIAKAYLGFYKGARATPTYDNGNLYLLTGTGEIGCYDASSGDAKWKRDFKEFKAVIPPGHRFGFSESVLIVGDLAIVSPGGDCFMVALDKNTGKTVWRSDKYAAAEHSSAIHVVYQGVPLIINGSRMGLVCVHAKTGEILWTQEFAPKNIANVPTPAFSDGYVFWAVGYGKGGICMKLSVSGTKVTAKEAWRTEEMDCHVGGYVIHDGHIYGNHKHGYTCLDLRTGEKKWFAKGVGKGSLCWADDMLYLFSEKDGLAGLATCSPGGMEMKGTFSVAGSQQSWAHPVVAGGRLYLRYDDNLYCFDVRQP